jgi:hypothetical protein
MDHDYYALLMSKYIYVGNQYLEGHMINHNVLDKIWLYYISKDIFSISGCMELFVKAFIATVFD